MQQVSIAPELSVACLRDSRGLSAQAMRKKQQGAEKCLYGHNLLWETQGAVQASTLTHLTTFL